MRSRPVIHTVIAAVAAATPGAAGEIVAGRGGGPAPFDIVRAEVAAEGGEVVFRMATGGEAGVTKPTPSGKLAGSTVHSYVWPTNLDSAAVGFEAGQGILAFAITSHPDFDDTPRRDENGDGRMDNDGDLWHSHWVVLAKDEACGPAALKVRDIPEGNRPRLPETWPGLPILIDSPDYPPALRGDTVEARVPRALLGTVEGARFDGVTAALRVNASVHAPLLCVADVFDIVSGDLSLPGTIE